MVGAAGVAEGFEQQGAIRVLCVVPFGVPLDAEGEGVAHDMDTLDGAIRGRGFDGQAGGQVVDGLTMDGVDDDGTGGVMSESS